MDKRIIKLEHYDYNEKGMVSDGEVSVNAIAKSITSDQMAELLDNYCNTFSGGYKRGVKTGEELQRSHRTLQRSVVVECVGIICGLADQEYTDARNERAVKLAKKIKELYEEFGAGMLV